MQIFVSLVGHVRGVVEGTSKKDSVTVFTIFMDHLTVVINSGQLPPPTVLVSTVKMSNVTYRT